MNILSLDIGKRKTGCALGYLEHDCIVALPSIAHRTREECIDGILSLVRTHRCTHVVVGLPRLPQGEEGSQATYVRDVIATLQKHDASLHISFIDERFTSQKKIITKVDTDAMAACTILEVEMAQRKKLLTK